MRKTSKIAKIAKAATTLKNKKDDHKFLIGLIFVAFGVVDVFILLFNFFNPLYPCPVDYSVSYPCSSPYPIQISQFSYSPYESSSGVFQNSAAYSNYSLSHEWASTTPKTEWEKSDFQSFAGDMMCYIASTTVSVSTSGESHKGLSFNYVLCPNNSPLFYPNLERNEIYATADSEQNYGFGGPAFKYWTLGKGESPETFINGLIKSLPSSLERSHCKLDSAEASKAKTPKGKLKHYSVSPDDAYKKLLASEGQEWYGLCYPYNNYFQLVGDVLVYISNSQDDSVFDPDSMRVATSSPR